MKYWCESNYLPNVSSAFISLLIYSFISVYIFCLSVIRGTYYVSTFHTCTPFYILKPTHIAAIFYSLN